MKMRTGFVSNSSSASYIITINKEKSEFEIGRAHV